MLRWATALALLAAPVAAQDYDVCQEVTCTAPAAPDLSSCKRRALFVEVMDPACQARLIATATQARASFQACVAEKASRAAACEALRQSRIQQVEKGVISTTATALPNGAPCATSSACRSGYCMPGPASAPAVSSVPQAGGTGWFCVAADRNCALEGTDGMMFGERISVDGQTLECQSPGKGLWAQFYPVR